jgi:hypothetical protein
VTVVAGINADYLVAREWQIASGRSFTSDQFAADGSGILFRQRGLCSGFKPRSAGIFGSRQDE